FAFSAASIFRLVFVVIIRSVYHDRTTLFQLRPWSHFQGPAHTGHVPRTRPVPTIPNACQI
ncbi:MAG: hypothetical protein M0Z28_23870, partial [Rhodospirillales bacterium]|nr:hypothetical protein [Rhodospirillales bacterium]